MTTTQVRTSRDIQYRILTPELIEKLCHWLALGNYECTACDLCDIDDTTLLKWKNQAAVDIEAGLSESESLTIRLVRAMKKAASKAEADRVKRIQDAGVGGAVTKRITRERRDGTIETEEVYQAPQWLADMTHLERRHPERWGRRDSLQVEENKTVNVSVVVKHYQADQLPVTPDTKLIEGEVRVLDIKENPADLKTEAKNDTSET